MTMEAKRTNWQKVAYEDRTGPHVPGVTPDEDGPSSVALPNDFVNASELYYRAEVAHRSSEETYLTTYEARHKAAERLHEAWMRSEEDAAQHSAWAKAQALEAAKADSERLERRRSLAAVDAVAAPAPEP